MSELGMSDRGLPTRGHFGARKQIKGLAAGIQELLTLGKGY